MGLLSNKTILLGGKQLMSKVERKNLKGLLISAVALTAIVTSSGVASSQNIKHGLDNSLQTVQTVVGFKTTTAHADDTQVANDASRKELNTSIRDTVSKNKYDVEGGGTITGSQLVKDGDIISVNYDKLTGSSKQKLVTDMVKTAETEAQKTADKQQKDGKEPSEGAISDQTVSDWISDIQSNPGVGSKMLTQTLQDVKPDYQSASYIIQPFKGPINTLIAVVVILVMLFLTLTFAIDLAYLYIPFFNAMSSDENGGGDGSKSLKPSSWVSREAKSAYSETEGGGNSALKYFKKRIVGSLMLGMCIMFFAQGQIFTIVGWLMDLVSGVLHLG